METCYFVENQFLILASSNAFNSFSLGFIASHRDCDSALCFFFPSFVSLGQYSTFLHFALYVLLLNHVSIISGYKVFFFSSFDFFSRFSSAALFCSDSIVKICLFNPYFYLLVFCLPFCLPITHRKTIHLLILHLRGGGLLLYVVIAVAHCTLITCRMEF